jgi:tape measure domain-containing protein
MSGVAIDVQTRSDSAERDLKKINESLTGIQKTTEGVTKSLANMAKSIALSAASVGGFAAIVQISDQFTNLGNKIALVTGRTNDMVYAQTKLLDITERTRGSIDDAAMAFGTFGKALKGSGASVDSLLKATEAVQKAVAISGSSAESAQAAIIQLGQGLSSGVLRGEEFNSIMEQTPRIAVALADSLNVSLGNLRAMAAEGKLTSDVVFKGLLSQTNQLNKEFALLAPTMSQGVRASKQAVSEFVNELLIGLGASEAVGGVTMKMASAIRDRAKTIAVDAAIFMANLRMMLANISVIGKPIIDLFKAIGTQIKAAFPSFWISRTLTGDLEYALRKIDLMFGGTLEIMEKDAEHFWDDFLTIDSPVEKAVKKLKRLTPTEWFHEGVHSGELKAFFSTEMMYLYADALRDLATAVADNSNSMYASYRDFGRKITGVFKDVQMYFGLIPDTLIRMRVGAVDALMWTVAQLIRGFTELGIKVYDIRRYVSETLGDTYVGVVNALKDVFMNAPRMLFNGIKSVFEYLVRVAVNTAQIIEDAWNNKIYGPMALVIMGIQKIARLMNGLGEQNRAAEFFKTVIAMSVRMAQEAGRAIQEFSVKIIQYFFEIWDAVIGHSWWTDTVESVINTSASLLSDVAGPLTKFSKFVVGLFKDIWNKTTNGEGFAAVADAIVAGVDNMATNIRPGFAKFKKTVVDGYKSLAQVSTFTNPLKSVAGWYTGKVVKREISYDVSWEPSAMQKMLHNFDVMTFQVMFKTAMMVDKAGKAIHKFCAYVIAEFREVWDAVIGHSWWTDTIDGVVDQSNSLIKRTKDAFSTFKNMVADTFDALAGAAGMKTTFASSLQGLGQLFGIVANDFSDKLVAGLEVFKDEMPQILKAVGIAAAGFAALLLPLGPFKKAVVFAIVDSLITASTLVSEKFSEGVFGASFTLGAGRAIGHVIASVVANFIADLPQMLNAIVGLVSGFIEGITSGLASKIPVIGTLIAKVFDVINFTGLTGPLGILGMYLYGNSILSFFAKLGIFTDRIGALQLSLENLGKMRTDLSSQQGILGKLIYGTVGAKSTVAGIGLILSSLGAFDSIFAGSWIMKMAANGGLLTVMLAGDKGIDKIADTFYSKVMGPLMLKIQEMTKKVSVGGSTLNDMLFGPAGSNLAIVERGRETLGKWIGKMEDYIVEQGAKWGKKGMDFMTILVMGSEQDTTVNQFKSMMDKIVDVAKNALKKIGEYAMKSDFLKKAFTGEDGNGGLVGKFKEFMARRRTQAPQTQGSLFGGSIDEQIRHAQRPANQSHDLVNQGDLLGGVPMITRQAEAGMQRVTVAANQANQAAARIGGPTGLLGRVVFGKWGLIGLTAAVALAFSSFAKAAENQPYTKSNKDFGIFDGIKTVLQSFMENDPIKTYVTGALVILGTLTAFFPGTMVPAIGGAMSLVGSIIASAFSPGVLAAFGTAFSALTAFIGANAMRLKLALGGMIAGGAAGAALGANNNDMMLLMGMATMASQAIMAIPAVTRAALLASLASFGKWVAGVIAGFMAIEAAAIEAWAVALWPFVLGAAAIAGTFATILQLFGEGEGFLEKWDNFMDSIYQKFGWLEKGVSRVRKNIENKIDPKDRKFEGMDLSYSLDGIDLKAIDVGITKSLDKVTDKMAEAVKQAKEQKDLQGEVEDSTMKTIRELKKQLDNVIAKARAASRKDLGDQLKDANASNQHDPDRERGFFGRMKDSFLNYSLHKKYDSDEARLKRILERDPGNTQAIKELDDIKGKRQTEYKANYNFADDFTKDLQATWNKIDPTFSIVADINQSSTEKTDNTRLKDNFEAAVANLNKANRRVLEVEDSGYSNSSGRKSIAYRTADMNRDSARAAVKMLSEQYLAAQQAEKAIQEYQAGLGTLDTQLKELNITYEAGGLSAAGDTVYATAEAQRARAEAMKAGKTEEEVNKASQDAYEEAYQNSLNRYKGTVAILAQLQKSLKRTKNGYQDLQKQLELRDGKAENAVDVRQGQDRNQLNPDQLLEVSNAKANTGFGIDFKALHDIPSAFKLEMNELIQQLEKQKLRLTYRDLIVTTDMSADAKRDADKRMAEALAAIGQTQDAIRKKFQDAYDMAPGVMGRVQAMKGYGVDETPEPVFTDLSPEKQRAYTDKQMHLKELKDILSSIQDGTASFKFDDKKVEDKFFGDLRKGIRDTTAELAEMLPTATNALGILERMGRIGFNVNANQLYRLPKKLRDDAAAKGDEYKEINFKLTREGSQNLSDDEKKALIAKQDALRKWGEEQSAKLPKSFSDKMAAVSAAGVNLDMGTAFRLPPGIIDQYMKIADEIGVITRQAARLDESSTPAQVSALGKSYEELVKKLRSLSEANMNYGEKLNFVNSNLQDAKVTGDEWARMTNKQRDAMIELAKAHRDYEEQLERSKNPNSKKAQELRARIRELEEQSKDNPGRTLGGAASDSINRAGVSTSESVVGRMNVDDQVNLKKMADQINLQKAKNLQEMNPQVRRAGEDIVADLTEKLTNAVAASTVTSGITAISGAGVNITQAGYNLVDEANRAMLQGMAGEIRRQQGIVATTLDPVARMAAQKKLNELTISLQNQVAKLTMDRANSGAYQAGQTLAQNMHQNMTQGISDVLKGKSTIKDALLGVVDTFTNGIIDSFVGGMTSAISGKGGILDTMMGGVGEGVFGWAKGLFGGNTQNEKDYATQAMQEAASAMKALVAAISGVMPGGLNPFSTPDTSASTAPIKAGLDSMGEKIRDGNTSLATILGGSLTSLGGMITAGLQGLMTVMVPGSGGGGGWLGIAMAGLSAMSGSGMFGAAAGAAGSASTMLTAADLSLPASMIRENASFMDSLSQLPDFKPAGQFAIGGVIPGTRGMPVPIIGHGGEVILNAAQQNALLHGGGAKSEATFNLHITGDVSTQTRQEIARMIPQIAAGVNQTNLEKGRR